MPPERPPTTRTKVTRVDAGRSVEATAGKAPVTVRASTVTFRNVPSMALGHPVVVPEPVRADRDGVSKRRDPAPDEIEAVPEAADRVRDAEERLLETPLESPRLVNEADRVVHRADDLLELSSDARDEVAEGQRPPA
jgi:hypothetical protein